ncbi:MAG: hypothetical protein AUH80_03905 [Chloroflexi bacterium 13_1_40CM_4_65_16]|nr:MAG: hypothetical protein AUH27_05375 [Chloroflexi bacterium 13_1_40CM_66_19]OLC48057.1 MAG: hypothetical protein AUH80_03905 [Chloroflexi bacterium 13_1_40CM_4_65_16]OLE73389.1 MAG: hypothetical protein AUG05_00425 [Actinobacteria bacterium 13_1_20CM_2_66_18]TMF34556.1 MAG: hypothetical protein E6I30_06060 [Chloroflexota bacterium]OLC19723.1 MAG: hypothetical protein AUH27_05390 [Chloroflexi bacterium 13_1_40CM_66_19]
MKLPPVLAEKVVPADGASKSERDRSFLIFASVVLVAIALGFKSELLGPGQVWALALGLVVIAAPALLGYLRGTAEFPRIEHYIPVALGAITLAGLSLFPDVQLWKYATVTALFGTGFVMAARLDYLRLRDQEKRGHIVLQELMLVVVVFGAYLVIVTLHFNPILQLLWIFTITFLASYRSFRINGVPITPRRAFTFALFVGQVVTFLAWAITALSLYLVVYEGTFAVMLLFAWYINRGLVRHTVEDSFTRNVILEYGAFAVVLIYLFVASYQPGR